jgi:hypothetical protein
MFKLFGAPGGKGGEPFDSGELRGVEKMGVEKVIIRAGKFVDSIQLVYRGGLVSKRFGGEGGQEREFLVPPNDYITTVKVWSGWGTDAIQFETELGIISPRFGGPGGKARIEAAGPGSQLVGIKGRCGKLVDEVNFKWANLSENVDSPAEQEVVVEKEAENEDTSEDKVAATTSQDHVDDDPVIVSENELTDKPEEGIQPNAGEEEAEEAEKVPETPDVTNDETIATSQNTEKAVNEPVESEDATDWELTDSQPNK